MNPITIQNNDTINGKTVSPACPSRLQLGSSPNRREFLFMSKDPAVLFYTSDFVIGTAFLSHEQVGKYIRLLCYQHQVGRLTKDQILSVTGIWDQEIMEKFTEKNGFFYNKRMEIEKDKRVNYCKSRSNNKSGRPIIRKSYDNHMENHQEL